MNEAERKNWKEVKEALEEANKTDCYFYKRAVAICEGDEDPIDRWK